MIELANVKDFLLPPKVYIIWFQLQTKFHTHVSNFRNKFVCALENISVNFEWRRRQNSCHSLSKRASDLRINFAIAPKLGSKRWPLP